MKKIIFLLILFLSFTLLAESIGTASSSSIDWQKIQLHDKIKAQIEEALETVLPQKKSIINVKIDMEPVPVFVAPAPPSAGGASEKEKKKTVKLSDVSMEKNPPEDFIVFSKLGIAAPVFTQEEPETSKVAPPPAAIDPATSYARLAEHYDFFKYLKAVSIDVYFDQAIPVAQKESAKKLIQEMSFNLGKIIPQINFKDVQIVSPELQNPIQKKDMIDVLGKFSNVIAFVLTAIIVAGLALVLFKRFSSLFKEQLDGLTAALSSLGGGKDKNLEKKDEKNPSPATGAVSNLAAGMGNNEQVNGLERFKVLLKQNQAGCVTLIKKWLTGSSEMSSCALVALASSLENEDILKLFSHLSLEDRKEWKKQLNRELSTQEHLAASAYINKQIAENLILPPLVSDGELNEVLPTLSFNELTEICIKDVKAGAVLFNLLDSKMISKILSTLDEGVSTQVMAAGLSLSEDEIVQFIPDFKKIILTYKKNSRQSPLAEKIIELIAVAPVEKERLLFTSYSKVASEDMFKKTAVNYFPQSLFSHLPDDVVKFALKNLQPQVRAELIFTLEPEKSKHFKTIWATPGTKAYDLLEFDLEKIGMNKILSQKVEESKLQLWDIYVETTRKLIRNNQDITASLQAIIQDWSKEFYKAEDSKFTLVA